MEMTGAGWHRCLFSGRRRLWEYVDHGLAC
jgi:hypothetical protein